MLTVSVRQDPLQYHHIKPCFRGQEYNKCFVNPEFGEGKVSIGICSTKIDAGFRGREMPKESVIWTDHWAWEIA